MTPLLYLAITFATYLIVYQGTEILLIGRNRAPRKIVVHTISILAGLLWPIILCLIVWEVFNEKSKHKNILNK